METLLQQLFATFQCTVDGKTLSVPRVTEIADAEAQAARFYLARIADSSKSLPVWGQEVMFSRAAEILQSPIALGSHAFNLNMFTSGDGLIYLGYLSLRVKHPEMKLSDAAALFAAHPESLMEVHKAWGSGKNLLGPAEAMPT